MTRDIWGVSIAAGILGLAASAGSRFQELWAQGGSAASLQQFFGIRLLVIALTLIGVHAIARAVTFRFRDEKGSNNNSGGQLKSALNTGFLDAVRTSPLNPENEDQHGHG